MTSSRRERKEEEGGPFFPNQFFSEIRGACFRFTSNDGFGFFFRGFSVSVFMRTLEGISGYFLKFIND